MTTLGDAARYLAARCDGAVSWDGAGFSKFDAEFGRSLASKPFESWTTATKVAAYKMLLKYRHQLASGGIDISQLDPEPGSTDRQIDVAGGKFLIKFDYVATLVEVVKQQIPGRWYDSAGKFWTAPASAAKQVAGLAAAHGFAVSASAQRLIDAPLVPASAPVPASSPAFPTAAGIVITSKFASSCAICRGKIDLGSQILWAKGSGSAHLTCARRDTVAASQAASAVLEIPGLRQELYPFQVAAVQFLEKVGGRALIADEMGLGKTVEALAWLQLHPEARPAVVVCPASVKLNWEREAGRWLASQPENVVAVLNGGHGDLPEARIYILNYDIISKWSVALQAIRPKVLILDECHYLKNKDTKRTKAVVGTTGVAGLADRIPHVIALSGTPLVNRPVELWTTLHLLAPRNFFNFLDYAKRYCSAHYNGYGWDFGGASNLPELQAKLRATVMIRRAKADVLTELPAKRRVTLPVELDNRKEYLIAEADFISWLRSQGKSFAELEKAARAEALVRLGGLKRLAATGKLAAVREWTENFLDTGEKLVLFAHHKEVISALLVAFPGAALIDGSTALTDRQAAVDRFQSDPGCRLIICSIRAAGIGITLTAASNVAFCEFGWTPGEHQQAEDRVHRIGQTNSVTAWYLLGQGTVDEDIAALIDQKQRVLAATLDSSSGEEEAGILGALIGKMLGN